MILGDWWTVGQCFSEIIFAAIAKGSLAVGELTIKGVECIGTFWVGCNESLGFGEHMYLFGGGVIDWVFANGIGRGD